MTPTQFKDLWLNADPTINTWATFVNKEIESAPLSMVTKEFLKVGFPDSAAPFLSFGLQAFKGKFHTVDQVYGAHLKDSHSYYLVLGSDGAGNPICFDLKKNDKIVLLDHEQDFELIGHINNDIEELANCLLAYRIFIHKIQSENGEDAYLNSDFTDEQYAGLEEAFQKINPKILAESDFWRKELENLLTERRYNM